MLLAPLLGGVLAACAPVDARPARRVALAPADSIEVRPDRAEFAAGEPITGILDFAEAGDDVPSIWLDGPRTGPRAVYAVTVTAAPPGGALACEPVRRGFRIAGDERLERLAARLGRRFAFLPPGDYALSALRSRCSFAEDALLRSFTVASDPLSATFDDLARLDPPPGIDADLAAELYERRVELGWNPAPELFLPAPASVEIAHDAAPFHYRVRRGDALAVAGRESEELHNFNCRECGFNVGILGRSEAPRKDEQEAARVIVVIGEDAEPGIHRVRCDVHRGRTLGWLLVDN